MSERMLKSPAWGNQAYPVFQEFGVIPDDPEMRSWYEYAKHYGHPAGTHIGIDVGTPLGTPIYALNHGYVEKSGFDPDNFRPKPITIVTKDDPNTIDDESGYKEIYGHLWENTVTTGQTVTPGQQIGFSGEQTYHGTMTPDTSGPHIHFEVLQPGADTTTGFRALNPEKWLKKQGIDLEPSPDNPPEDDGNGGGLPSLPDIGGLGAILNSVMQQGAFMLIGIALLAVGLIAVLRSNGGIGRTARKVIPAARVISSARKAMRD